MYIRFMNSKLFRGTLDTIILTMLRDNGRMYGYEITKSVKEQSKGEIKITEGSLYPALHKLERKGYLDIELVKVNSRMRKYYTLSKKGNAAVKEEVKELQSFINSLSLIVNPHN